VEYTVGEEDEELHICIDGCDENYDESNSREYFHHFYALATSHISYYPSSESDGWVYFDFPQQGLSTLSVNLFINNALATPTNTMYVEIEFQ